MVKATDHFYSQQSEPVKSCLLALKAIILSQDSDITNEWKYGMPFFCYRGKMFCYLWYHKKYKQPYIGMVEGASLNYPELIREKRSRMKIMLIDPGSDIPVHRLNMILQQAINLYRSGEILIKKK